MTWMLLILTFATLLTMALSVHRAAEEAHEALCDCMLVEPASAVVIPFPAAQSPGRLSASA